MIVGKDVECPDVFVEGNYQYLIYSGIGSRKVHYKYRKQGTSAWITPTSKDLDGISFYAAKTASNGNNRYLFGWTPTRVDNNDVSNFSWGGSLVVHELKQNTDGTLSVAINSNLDNKIATIQDLKVVGSKYDADNSGNYKLIVENRASQDYVTFDRLSGITKIKADIKPGSATEFGFEFASSGNRREVFTLEFDTKNKKIGLNRVLRLDNIVQTIDSVDLPDTQTGGYSVTILIENSVCVIYINDKIAFSNRIYLMTQNAWGIYANNGDVQFSNIQIYK